MGFRLEGGADVASAPLRIQFDPKILRLNDVTRGDLLAMDGQQPVFTKNIMNDAGTATIQLSRQPGTAGVNGGGVLVTLNFQTIGRGVTVVKPMTPRGVEHFPSTSGEPLLTRVVKPMTPRGVEHESEPIIRAWCDGGEANDAARR